MTDRGGQSPDARRPGRPDPADSVQRALSVLLESVAPAERAAYILYELMGLSLTQTAAVLHRSPAATKRMAECARLQLRARAATARMHADRPVTSQGRAVSHSTTTQIRRSADPTLGGITMQTNKKIAVAGATGRVGRHVVDVLQGAGHDVVAISRSSGVDVITGDGLADALDGVEVIIDTATGASPEQHAAVEFFTASARNLQQAGQRAGVQRIVVVSILGCDRLQGGYGASTLVHEPALASAGEIPVSVLRATQFHEFVEALVQWGTRGDVTYVPEMRTQLIAARSVADRLVQLATDPAPRPDGTTPILEIAGPRPESMVEMAKLLVAHSGSPLRVQAVDDPSDPDHDLNVSGGLLPGPDAEIAGPTFAQWLDTRGPAAATARA